MVTTNDDPNRKSDVQTKTPPPRSSEVDSQPTYTNLLLSEGKSIHEKYLWELDKSVAPSILKVWTREQVYEKLFNVTNVTTKNFSATTLSPGHQHSAEHLKMLDNVIQFRLQLALLSTYGGLVMTDAIFKDHKFFSKSILGRFLSVKVPEILQGTESFITFTPLSQGRFTYPMLMSKSNTTSFLSTLVSRVDVFLTTDLADLEDDDDQAMDQALMSFHADLHAFILEANSMVPRLDRGLVFPLQVFL